MRRLYSLSPPSLSLLGRALFCDKAALQVKALIVIEVDCTYQRKHLLFGLIWKRFLILKVVFTWEAVIASTIATTHNNVFIAHRKSNLGRVA